MIIYVYTNKPYYIYIYILFAGELNINNFSEICGYKIWYTPWLYRLSFIIHTWTLNAHEKKLCLNIELYLL